MAAPVMEHGTSIEQLGQRFETLREGLVGYAEEAWDDTFSMKDAKITAEGKTLYVQPQGHRPLPMVGNALGTLCWRLDIPRQFIERCISHDMADHAALTLQRFLSRWVAARAEPSLLLRIRETNEGSAVRAFCSLRYGKFDNVEALDLLKENLPVSLGEPVALKSYGDADNLSGTLLFPETSVRVDGDSDYYLGLYYRNSEVCESAFGISAFLFRSYCTNTAIWGRKDAGAPDIKIVHSGEIDVERIKHTLAAGVAAAVENGPNLLKLLGYAREVPVQQPKQTIAYLACQNHMAPEVARTWYAGYREEECPTAAGLVNGLTRGAQSYQGPARVGMETVACEILSPSILAGPEEVSSHWGYFNRGAASMANTKPKQLARYFPEFARDGKK